MGVLKEKLLVMIGCLQMPSVPYTFLQIEEIREEIKKLHTIHCSASVFFAVYTAS